MNLELDLLGLFAAAYTGQANDEEDDAAAQ